MRWYKQQIAARSISVHYMNSGSVGPPTQRWLYMTESDGAGVRLDGSPFHMLAPEMGKAGLRL